MESLYLFCFIIATFRYLKDLMWIVRKEWNALKEREKLLFSSIDQTEKERDKKHQGN